MDSELATLVFMGLILKIPVVAMLWLVWWACRSVPDPAEAEGGEDGHGFRRWRPQPPPPRRGPHGPTAPAEAPASAQTRRAPHPPAPQPAALTASARRQQR